MLASHLPQIPGSLIREIALCTWEAGPERVFYFRLAGVCYKKSINRFPWLSCSSRLGGAWCELICIWVQFVAWDIKERCPHQAASSVNDLSISVRSDCASIYFKPRHFNSAGIRVVTAKRLWRTPFNNFPFLFIAPCSLSSVGNFLLEEWYWQNFLVFSRCHCARHCVMVCITIISFNSYDNSTSKESPLTSPTPVCRWGKLRLRKLKRFD